MENKAEATRRIAVEAILNFYDEQCKYIALADEIGISLDHLPELPISVVAELMDCPMDAKKDWFFCLCLDYDKSVSDRYDMLLKGAGSIDLLPRTIDDDNIDIFEATMGGMTPFEAFIVGWRITAGGKPVNMIQMSQYTGVAPYRIKGVLANCSFDFDTRAEHTEE